jgi:hypothetical protein
MFDRASMKLGLDKALLQRASAESDPFENKSKPSLSKEEVEDLLKKGAYGAFMDDGAGDQFCEEDIDQILERRTMVIRHDGDVENRKGSMFSKASFQSNNSSANVDVNDPDFWDKVAKQAELNVIDEIPGEESLILDAPRARKQFVAYGKEGEESIISDYSRRYLKPADVKSWTNTERAKLERLIMQHGFFHFDLMTKSFSKRTAEQLKVCCRALILRCLEAFTPEKDMLADIKRALAIFYPTVPPKDDSEESRIEFENRIESEEQEILEIPKDQLPWAGADLKNVCRYFNFSNLNIHHF